MRILVKIASLFVIFLLNSCDSMNKKNDVNLNVTVSNLSLERVEPPHWWIGFKNKQLQLLVKEDSIGLSKVEIMYPGVTIEKINKANSPNYLFIDLIISESAKAGKFDIIFRSKTGKEKTHTYELKSRVKESHQYKGFNSSDAIYLITPDRFANADESNDVFDHLKEKTVDRTNDYARHGGDIKGITSHLDYISDLGYTAIWSTPFLLMICMKAHIMDML